MNENSAGYSLKVRLIHPDGRKQKFVVNFLERKALRLDQKTLGIQIAVVIEFVPGQILCRPGNGLKMSVNGSPISRLPIEVGSIVKVAEYEIEFLDLPEPLPEEERTQIVSLKAEELDVQEPTVIARLPDSDQEGMTQMGQVPQVPPRVPSRESAPAASSQPSETARPNWNSKGDSDRTTKRPSSSSTSSSSKAHGASSSSEQFNDESTAILRKLNLGDPRSRSVHPSSTDKQDTVGASSRVKDVFKRGTTWLMARTLTEQAVIMALTAAVLVFGIQKLKGSDSEPSTQDQAAVSSPSESSDSRVPSSTDTAPAQASAPSDAVVPPQAPAPATAPLTAPVVGGTAVAPQVQGPATQPQALSQSPQQLPSQSPQHNAVGGPTAPADRAVAPNVGGGASAANQPGTMGNAPAAESIQTSSGGFDALSLDMFFNAIERGDTFRIRDMLESRTIDVNLSLRRGYSPLHFAAANGNPTVVKTLLEYRANPNAKDPAGSTPLMWAVYRRHTAVVKLLAPVTDLTIQRDGNETALDLAKAQKSTEYYRLLTPKAVRKTASTKSSASSSSVNSRRPTRLPEKAPRRSSP